jgi:hypothetical protein
MLMSVLTALGLVGAMALGFAGYAPIGLLAFVLLLKYSKPWED